MTQFIIDVILFVVYTVLCSLYTYFVCKGWNASTKPYKVSSVILGVCFWVLNATMFLYPVVLFLVYM